MYKLDSFLKESIRLHPQGAGVNALIPMLNSVTLQRLALKPYRFSNGVVVPKGTIVGAPVCGIHMDDAIYERASEFDGFRFSKMREKYGDNAKFNAVDSTTQEYLHFGNGPHAWYLGLKKIAHFSPGRFFAINEIKLMLAFTLWKYEVKNQNGKRPPDVQITAVNLPNPKAQIFFKKRG